MRFTRALVVVAVVVLASSGARAASIGIFSTPDCSSCNLVIPPGESRTLYIKVRSGSLRWSGAEFRVVGLPGGWAASSTPNPAALVVMGDPFGNRANVAGFQEAQSGNCTLLYTVEITATSSENDVVLRVAAGDPPSNPEYDSPLLVPAADIPCFCNYRVAGGALFINSGTECTVSVVPSTWSQVKQLYD